MKTIILSAFKANCIALLREAQKTSEPIIVTRRGRPLARIEPLREPTPVRRFGKQRGRMRIKGDIVQSAIRRHRHEGPTVP